MPEKEESNQPWRFSSEAGYDPRAMLEVMAILAEASEGMRQREFFSTHANPERRTERIQAAIAEHFPEGVPDGLTPKACQGVFCFSLTRRVSRLWNNRGSRPADHADYG